MGINQFLTIAFLNVIGALSPGPDVVLTTRQATRSRKHALASTFGISLGVLFWVSVTVLGATAILNAFPQILDVIQIVGGGWLIYMGQSMVRTGWADRMNPPLTLTDSEARLGTIGKSFKKGLATNLSNPKIVLFLAALIAPMLPAHPSITLALFVILALWASSTTLFVLISFVISTNAIRQKLLSGSWAIDVVAGLFFLVVGVILFLRGAFAIIFAG